MTKYRASILMAGAAAVYVAFASGCTDLKPIRAQLEDLKSQVSRLNVETARMTRDDTAAASAARSAALAAQHAQSTADTANGTATKNQQAIEAINEKIDRMFRRSISK
jgi:outer membrane murein-binding lipoprotein Lpp